MIKEILRGSNNLAKSLYHDIREFLSPSSCLGCHGDNCPESSFFCGDCLGSLRNMPGEGPLCPICRRPAGVSGRCLFCASSDSPRMCFWGRYDGLLKDAILLFKFKGISELGRELSEIAAGQLESRLRLMNIDEIVPIPLYRARQRERGFNQSEIIAAALVERLGVECRGDLLVRIRHTAQQAKLEEKRRWENVKGAFALAANVDLSGKRILLVDDIVTTGATIHEASLPLRNCGASVAVFSLAYAV